MPSRLTHTMPSWVEREDRFVARFSSAMKGLGGLILDLALTFQVVAVAAILLSEFALLTNGASYKYHFIQQMLQSYGLSVLLVVSLVTGVWGMVHRRVAIRFFGYMSTIGRSVELKK